MKRSKEVLYDLLISKIEHLDDDATHEEVEIELYPRTFIKINRVYIGENYNDITVSKISQVTLLDNGEVLEIPITVNEISFNAYYGQTIKVTIEN